MDYQQKIFEESVKQTELIEKQTKMIKIQTIHVDTLSYKIIKKIIRNCIDK